MPDDEETFYIGRPEADISLLSIAAKRENKRGLFATILISVYLLIGSFIVFGSMLWDVPDGGLDAAITIISLIGPIVGTVVGFYFGENRRT